MTPSPGPPGYGWASPALQQSPHQSLTPDDPEVKTDTQGSVPADRCVRAPGRVCMRSQGSKPQVTSRDLSLLGFAALDGQPQAAWAAAGEQGLSTRHSVEQLNVRSSWRHLGPAPWDRVSADLVSQQRWSPAADHGHSHPGWGPRPSGEQKERSRPTSPAPAQEERNVTAAQETCF